MTMSQIPRYLLLPLFLATLCVLSTTLRSSDLESSSTASQRNQRLRALHNDIDQFWDGLNGTIAPGQENESTLTCPPCPQCQKSNGPPAPEEEPLTLQILVVDSPGIITMGGLRF